MERKEEPDNQRRQTMTLQEAIEARHSVRAYKNEPLTDGVVKALEEQIAVLNSEGKLHMQLILNEPKAFQGTMAKYGKFRNANNYIVMAGKKAEDLDERIGYYGEHLVLLAQTLGLNTCWVGLSYSKVPGTYELGEDEKKTRRLLVTLPSVMVRHKVSAIKSRPSSKSAMPVTSLHHGSRKALKQPCLLLQP